MNASATVFEAEFRSQGYDETDRLLLREALNQFGAVRLRPMDLPEAGGSTELYLAVAFIGSNIASGLIGHLTGKTFDKLFAALLRFYQTRKQRDGVEPEMALKISYDDLDLDIGPVDEGDLKHVPALANEIHRLLTSGSLKDIPVTRIVVGMVRHGDDWSEPHLWDRSEEGQRFWGVSLEGHRTITHILDTQTGLLSERTSGGDLPGAHDDDII